MAQENQFRDAAPRRMSGRTLHLALQGGGAHGAFTWGVLDRLLEEPELQIGRISGASAGALNGAALATGMACGGPEQAKRTLALLWRRVSEAGLLMTWLHVPLKKPGLGIWDDATPIISPYLANPLALEPLRYVLSSIVDIDRMREPTAPPLFVNAVNVNTGVSRVFGPADMSIAALMASASAPLTFPAVPIDGDSYWDGSYGANPMLWPLYDPESVASGGHDSLDAGAIQGLPTDDDGIDVLLVELTPLRRAETPTTAKNILNRINEIASINGLLSELRAVHLVNRAAAAPKVRMHVLSFPGIGSDADLEPSRKRTVDPLLFEALRQQGRTACDRWLQQNGELIGQRATVDIHQRYLVPMTRRGAQSSGVQVAGNAPVAV
ncbi:MAG TPA: patatin-like phospholipase family protein [Rubrivivax sp.]|nr:patatin-like phospholipase family protein [Rubrivivax sp.]